jgi:hypothetical protein
MLAKITIGVFRAECTLGCPVFGVARQFWTAGGDLVRYECNAEQGCE